MKHTFLFLAGSLLLVGTARAQVGLRVGGTLMHLVVSQAPVRYLDTDNSVKLGY